MGRLRFTLVVLAFLASTSFRLHAAIDYTALRTELQTDPQALGYNATAGNDVAKADLLNLARATITIRRTDISSAEIWSAIDVTDMTALPANPTAAQLSSERRFIAWLTGVAAVTGVRLQNDNGTDTPVIANFKATFTAGSGTLTRLAVLATRNGSRAEQLFGAGTTITSNDVARALRP